MLCCRMGAAAWAAGRRGCLASRGILARTILLRHGTLGAVIANITTVRNPTRKPPWARARRLTTGRHSSAPSIQRHPLESRSFEHVQLVRFLPPAGRVDEQSQRDLSLGSKVTPAKRQNMRQRSNSPKCVSWASPSKVSGKKTCNDMQESIRSKNMDRREALVPSH